MGASLGLAKLSRVCTPCFVAVSIAFELQLTLDIGLKTQMPSVVRVHRACCSSWLGVMWLASMSAPFSNSPHESCFSNGVVSRTCGLGIIVAA